MGFHVPLACVKKQSDEYASLTTEVYRADYTVIGNLYRKYPSAFDNVMQWMKSIHPQITTHLVQDRLLKYLNQPSRDGRYTEVSTNFINLLT